MTKKTPSDVGLSQKDTWSFSLVLGPELLKTLEVSSGKDDRSLSSSDDGTLGQVPR
jgi:hypothetical protein